MWSCSPRARERKLGCHLPRGVGCKPLPWRTAPRAPLPGVTPHCSRGLLLTSIPFRQCLRGLEPAKQSRKMVANCKMAAKAGRAVQNGGGRAPGHSLPLPFPGPIPRRREATGDAGSGSGPWHAWAGAVSPRAAWRPGDCALGMLGRRLFRGGV